ncbi:hypothetical protein [Flagellimonas sp. CMM7]|uniref:hypothetical protein n=1 Tax=Flagellimonas sp. CMM7 TaxID=2654676 RepID=UPI0013CFA7C9|nr:hypothetical protein [Flagellimonas sp. CMM7]UII79214.1 hypothetical protein LV704_16325 [Flagellimonas sp. CMM7]
MKLQRIFMLGLIATSMALITSCSDGEDGADGLDGATGPAGAVGPAGAAGADGTDGVDGTNGVDGADGTDGADGNANVRRVIFDTSNLGQQAGPIYSIDDENTDLLLTQEVLETHTLLLYAVIPGSSTYVPLPGTYRNGLNDQIWGVHFGIGAINIRDVTGQGWPPFFDEVHLILIEQSSVTDTSDNGQQAKSQVDVIKSLKAANVDVNNYHEVVEYFNID